VSAKLAATFNSTGVTILLPGFDPGPPWRSWTLRGERSGHPTKQQRPVRGDPPVGAPSKAIGAQASGPDGNPDSDLAQRADFRLLYAFAREAARLELAHGQQDAAMALGTPWPWSCSRLAASPRRLRPLSPRRQPRTCPSFAGERHHAQGSRLPIAADSVSVQGGHPRDDSGKERSIALVNRRTGKLTGILTDGDFRRSRPERTAFSLPARLGFHDAKSKTVDQDPSGRRLRLSRRIRLMT